VQVRNWLVLAAGMHVKEEAAAAVAAGSVKEGNMYKLLSLMLQQVKNIPSGGQSMEVQVHDGRECST
jgi:hypothetical protein